MVVMMEFDRPVFRYPPIGADGNPVACVTLPDFQRIFDHANCWRLECHKERDRILSTKCEENPNVNWNRLVKELTAFFSDMGACKIRYIEAIRLRRANEMKCQVAAAAVSAPVTATNLKQPQLMNAQGSKKGQELLNADTKRAHEQQANRSGVAIASTDSQMLHQRITNSSALISNKLPFQLCFGVNVLVLFSDLPEPFDILQSHQDSDEDVASENSPLLPRLVDLSNPTFKFEHHHRWD
jgi:hypothetical protein